MKNSKHQPVLLAEVLATAAEMSTEPKLILDATFGRGGHLSALHEKYPTSKFLALDKDEQAIRAGRELFLPDSSRVHFLQTSFSQGDKVIEEARKVFKSDRFDFILVDLGVSSPQLDQPERGFSFYHDGPLDMRMDQSEEVDAAALINQASEEELVKIFKDYGEVPRPFRVVRAILHDRKTKPFETTRQLASLIERVEGWGRKGHHPATRYFLGLRLCVNSELDETKVGLNWMIRALAQQGRLAVITFHSLEDRIAKRIFKESTIYGKLVNRKVIKPSREEIASNPRARSAQLRVFEKGLEEP